jgi:hypothetical protein
LKTLPEHCTLQRRLAFALQNAMPRSLPGERIDRAEISQVVCRQPLLPLQEQHGIGVAFPWLRIVLVLDEESAVLDLVFVIATVVFFALAWAYVRACGQA